ncbi:MAG: OmpH family outer membrane protein [Bacteroidales bacterium]|nr:OmpH family outer membrane protein [Bacteroidales bacterium]
MLRISNISILKLSSILISLFLLNVSVADAQTLKLGYFDSKAIFESIPEKSQIQKEIENLQAAFEVEESMMLEEYKAKVAKFLEEKDRLNENIAEARAQEIDQLQQRIEQFRERCAKELKATQESLLAPLLEKISLSIRSIGENYGFACIFDISEGGVAFISPSMCEDCTELIKSDLGIK